MELKVSVFIATSLDGFIAREDGNLDWLDAANQTVTPGEDCGYGSFIKDVDMLIMGRKSFEKVLSFGIDWPYANLPVIVLSRSNVEIPSSLPDSVSSSSESPKALLKRLESTGTRHVYLNGALNFVASGVRWREIWPSRSFSSRTLTHRK